MRFATFACGAALVLAGCAPSANDNPARQGADSSMTESGGAERAASESGGTAAVATGSGARTIPGIQTASGTPGTAAADAASAADATVASSGTTTPLSDGEILGVLATANAGEVALGQLAATKATSEQVRQFAQKIVHEHSAAGEKVEAAGGAGNTPRDSDVSRHLEQQADRTTDDLENREGDDFDRAFVRAQVDIHRQVLRTIDERLVPAAEDGEVRSLLQELRQHLTGHLADAERLQQAIELGG